MTTYHEPADIGGRPLEDKIALEVIARLGRERKELASPLVETVVREEARRVLDQWRVKEEE